MQDVTALSDTELIDLLALETSKYLDLLNGGATKDELNHCGGLINRLQWEIETRKSHRRNKGPDWSNDTDRMDRGTQIQ